MTDREAARDEIHDAKPDDWHVRRTTHEEHRREWTRDAFDTRERPMAGRRPREWTALNGGWDAGQSP